MQTGVSIEDTHITGTLNYVEGYTGFHGSDPTQQEGNYLALLFDTDPEVDSITVELTNSVSGKGPVKLDSDMMFVCRVTDKDSQTIKVVATKNSKSVTKTYDIAGLTLSPKLEE